MEFIRKLFSRADKEEPVKEARGAAPVQSEEEQTATRERMEAEMTSQREQREAKETSE